MSRIETIDLVTVVDELAELKARIAPLQEREASLKNLLKATGRERIDGTGHTAVIILSEPEVLDKKRLAADLGAELWSTYVSRPNVVMTCRLTARKTH